MFFKGKRRRRFIAFAPSQPDASPSSALPEMARVAASFEPARFELDDRPLEVSPDRDAPRPVNSAGHENARAHAATVSEAPDGEKIYHFGCYLPAGRFYLERKITTAAKTDSRHDAIHQRTER
jgi:hypothetical protein